MSDAITDMIYAERERGRGMANMKIMNMSLEEKVNLLIRWYISEH